MPSRSVPLTDDDAALVDRLVAADRYDDAAEVVHEALRLLEARENDPAERLRAFRAAIAEGEAAIARGDYIDLDSDEDIERFVRSLAADPAAPAADAA